MLKQLALVSLSLLLSLSSVHCLASDTKGPDTSKPLKRAEKAYDQFEFIKAIDHYKVAFLRDPNNADITRRLGECYRKLGLLDEAEYWYSKTVQGDNVIADDLYFYARVLTGMGQYTEARVWYNRYHQVRPDDEKVLPVIENETYFEDLLAMNPANEIRNLELNNDKPTMCAIPFEEGILFSAAGLDQVSQEEQGQVYWEFDQYLDMFYAEVDNEGRINNPQVVEDINTLYNDGPVAFDPHHGMLYVTQNQVKRAKPLANKDGEVQLKIRMFHYNDGQWKDKGDFPYTSTEYSMAHPSMSPNGQHLYFASNMPGGHGGTDIYRCERTSKGWAEPENLGSTINTSGNEVFPFEAGNNVLYFSSDGYPGLGGLDVFRTYSFDHNWTAAENMGVPINSAQDDFGLTFVKSSSGFFSSNRKGKGLDDDIFWFDLLSRRKFFQVAMQQLGQDAGIPMEAIQLRNLDTGEIMDITEVEGGISSFEAIEQYSYELSWEGEDKTNRILFLNDEHEVEGRSHQMGEYNILPDVDDKFAIDVRLSDKLKSSSNDLEKLLQEFNVYNVTDNGLYVNPEVDSPSWMQEYAMSGTFDYSQGLEDMAGKTVTIKDRSTGALTTRVVDENSSINFEVNPDHEYDVYWEEGDKLYQHILLPKGNYFEVENFAAHNSVLHIDLINHEAERQALIALANAELELVELANNQVKVMNLTTGEITTYTAGKSREIAIPTGSSHGYEVFWRANGQTSQHTILTSEGLDVVDHQAPLIALETRLEGDAIIANLSTSTLRDRLTATLAPGQIVLLNNLTLEVTGHQHDAAGVLQTALKTDRTYQVFWQTEEGLLAYDLEAQDAGTSLVGRNQLGTARPLRSTLVNGIASLSLGELPAAALALDMVYFDYNQSQVRLEDHSALLQAAKVLVAHPEMRLEIAGHTDNRGSNKYNLALSEKRADAVRAFLIEQGIDPERLSTHAEGEDAPMASCETTGCTETQHQQNRRAQLRLVSEDPNE